MSDKKIMDALDHLLDKRYGFFEEGERLLGFLAGAGLEIVQKDKWQDISTAKSNIRYLLTNGRSVWFGRGGNIAEGYWFKDGGYPAPTPTHWQPPLQPPQGDE